MTDCFQCNIALLHLALGCLSPASHRNARERPRVPDDFRSTAVHSWTGYRPTPACHTESMGSKAPPTLGWIIEVSERGLGGRTPSSRRYYVAIADEDKALLAVYSKSDTVNPTVRGKREITDPKMLSLLNLRRGRLLRLP